MKFKNFMVTAVMTAIAVLLTAFSWTLPIKAQQPALTQTMLAQSLSPNILVKTIYYPIIGSTAEQLRAQINQFRPVDPNFGQRFDASTEWFVRWKYRYTVSGNRCKIAAVEVSTTITTILPEWQNSQNSSRQLNNQWNRYLNALKIHEDGHTKHGINAGNEILQILNNFPDYPSCKRLADAANTAANRLIKKYTQRDIRYDQKTRHGVTQGAVFP